MNNELIEKALQIATMAHKGQTDKAGNAYISHPIRVALQCSTYEEKIVALLHDVVEDTDVTAAHLRAEGFPEQIVEAVLSVTKREEESYHDFVVRASHNPIGRQVKLYDLKDNMDITRLPLLTDDDLPRLNKYIEAYRYLLGQEER